MTKKQISLFVVLSMLIGCTSPKQKDFVVIGVQSDVEFLNPLYAFSVTEGNIAYLLYLPLIDTDWDSEKGEIKYSPMLAKEWSWSNNKKELILTLRDDIYWSDSVKFSVDDVIFSFDVFSDPKVKSSFFGYFDKFYTKDDKIDISKTFEIIGENVLKIKFPENSNPNLSDIAFYIIPKHVFGKINREELPLSDFNNNLVCDGAYRLVKWNKSQSIILEKNENSFLFNNRTIPKIVFKVLPEYQTRINQLLHGEIDMMEDIEAGDISKLKGENDLAVVPISGRDFEYIGWNNIDPKKFKNNIIEPNLLFSSPKVRRALTIALNREVVIKEFLHGYGQLASSPISPIFKTIYDASLDDSLKYNPIKAISLLKEEGWEDHNGNGIIDKKGKEFKFTLHISSGNPRRNFAASLFKNNLKSIGIEMNIQTDEFNVLIDNLNSKSYNAWMAVRVIPLPIDLQVSWNSDPQEGFLNYPSYKNSEVDSLLNEIRTANRLQRIDILRKVQRLIAVEQPYSFLYWVDNIFSYNKRIKNVSPSPLGALNHCWKWEL